MVLNHEWMGAGLVLVVPKVISVFFGSFLFQPFFPDKIHRSFEVFSQLAGTCIIIHHPLRSVCLY
ncbi:hypothetical protein C2R22_04955 [Salinigranum rubrum]|uniref:Uncharacterized protein n=1 Tax=Salinigranum rubrum TaxID=755307 RepID=A0A2I8VGM2_9EURY|nr:hypothetical protein C2R22_04955 [Salinigranum rubrum]